MDWSDERYVRVYTRDTPDWAALSWEAQALFLLLLRKVDRAGVLSLGRSGEEGLAGLLRMPPDVVKRGLSMLTHDGCVTRSHDGSQLVVPNFIAAQEARQSDKQRQHESRARRRDSAKHPELNNTGHTVSQDVTACHSVPSRTVPSRTVLREEIVAPPRDAAPLAAGSSAPLNLPGLSPGVATPAERQPAAREGCCQSTGGWLQVAEAEFCRLHRERLGLPYVHAYARDRKALKRLTEEYRPHLADLMAKFFDQADDFVFGKQGPSIPVFVDKVATLLQRRRSGGFATASLSASDMEAMAEEIRRRREEVS